MTNQIFAAEINFEDAPAHVREEFKGTENNIKRILKHLRPVVEEVYALSTHDRFTIYAVHENIVPITDFFHLQHNLKGHVHFYYNTQESVTHLFATSSGLLSQIKGEPRILSEIDKSIQWASACGCLGITLDNLLRKTLEIGKAVRTATAIDKFCVSVVETGIELLYDNLENLHKKNFLIVGTSKIADLALAYLCKEGIRNIVITSHNYGRALQLARQFDVKACSIEKTSHLILHCDVIIGASHQEVKLPFHVPPAKNDDADLQHKKNRFILDFGTPQNFDSKISEVYNAEFFNLDDLRRRQQSLLDSFGGLELAWSMVMKESNKFVYVLHQLHHSPVLTDYLTRLFSLTKSEGNLKLKGTSKNIILCKKSADTTGGNELSGKEYRSAKALVNNHRAENPGDLVRDVKPFKKFKFYLPEN